MFLLQSTDEPSPRQGSGLLHTRPADSSVSPEAVLVHLAQFLLDQDVFLWEDPM